MSKQEQVLQIEPQNELRFRGPFNVPVTSYMKLTNPSDKKVLFKIKTTAPKKYCVRPNSGILDAHSNTEIAICLQPFVFDPNEKNKHKFMVQTVFAPDEEFNLEQLWREISPEQLMDSKLKCVFELPVDQNESQASVQEEVAKLSPKVTSPTSTTASSNLEAELEKAAAEVRVLREEESILRQDNLMLKEEILRLKHLLGDSVETSLPRKYNPSVQTQNIPVAYIAIGVIIAVFGMILGKFIL
ncbi:vesicle-associated membrane protein-associated protein B/C [Agrilus planipennis]|uniref:Vesicle-associated membrane protein-associated protein B/C n=1 Tax=Agrilus planipennis TaxID=224129 RepID=A0A1W4WV52_AGRPL|nr:vesicle-associated membrane protein-associated protein B/C [Agrilus planipennis]